MQGSTGNHTSRTLVQGVPFHHHISIWAVSWGTFQPPGFLLARVLGILLNSSLCVLWGTDSSLVTCLPTCDWKESISVMALQSQAQGCWDLSSINYPSCKWPKETLCPHSLGFWGSLSFQTVFKWYTYRVLLLGYQQDKAFMPGFNFTLSSSSILPDTYLPAHWCCVWNFFPVSPSD